MTKSLFRGGRDPLRRFFFCCKTSIFQICFLVPLKKMTKRREENRITVARATSFFVITADAPRRARGRDKAIFFVAEEACSGVYFSKRVFSKTRVLVNFLGIA